MLLALGGKSGDGNKIRAAGVPIPDVGGGEVPKSFCGVFGSQKERRQVIGGGSDGGELASGGGREAG